MGSYFLCWGALLNLDAGALMLPKCDVPGFVHFPWEALPFPGSERGVCGGGVGGGEVRITVVVLENE